MRVLKIAAGVLVAVVVLFFVVGGFLPNELRVSRDAHVAAPIGVVFDQVNDLANWEHWSPWAERDPSMTVEIGEPSAGEGATMHWVSENQGEGSQTITLSKDNERIETHLDFGEMGEADARWMFMEMDGGTHVTWAFDETAEGVVDRYVFLMIEDFLIQDYDRGLANLKARAESLPAPEPATMPSAMTAPSEMTAAAATTADTAAMPEPQ